MFLHGQISIPNIAFFEKKQKTNCSLMSCNLVCNLILFQIHNLWPCPILGCPDLRSFAPLVLPFFFFFSHKWGIARVNITCQLHLGTPLTGVPFRPPINLTRHFLCRIIILQNLCQVSDFTTCIYLFFHLFAILDKGTSALLFFKFMCSHYLLLQLHHSSYSFFFL